MKTFPCGCTFPVDKNEKIIFKPDVETIPKDCSATWDLICNGHTKGIFQLEKQGNNAKRVQPRNIEELSDLIAIIRPGCVSGDTYIVTSVKSKKDGNRYFKRKRLSELFLNKEKYKTLISCDEDTGEFIENELKNIYFTGKKDTYKVLYSKRSTGKVHVGKNEKVITLECTNDHKLLTNRGWVELQDMKIGDRFAIIKFYGTTTGRSGNYTDGEKYFRDRCFKHYERKCIFCDWNEASLDVNHINGNRKTNNNPDNLCFMCPNHHRMYSEGKISNHEIITAREKFQLPYMKDFEWAEYKGKEYLGLKDVYDISMNSPHHNFIAGNVVVHNCTESFIKGKSLTQHYIDRKHGREDVEYLHPALEPILASTQGILVYQEQAMAIAKDLAGFSLQEADTLRKAIGKKNVELMAKIKKEFISKAIDHGTLNAEEAAEVFSWIEASQRYSFNKSHSYAYATNGYLTAYCKAHFPHEFFTSYLKHAIGKPDTFEEINELVSDARIMDIEVKPPNIKILQKDFKLIGYNPTFGITNIKGVGDSVFDKMMLCDKKLRESCGFKLSDMNFDQFLIYYGPCIKKDSFIALIMSGACDCFHLSRIEMKYRHEQYIELNKRELEWISTKIYNEQFDSLIDLLNEMILRNDWSDKKRPIYKKDRLEIISSLIDNLENPLYNLEESSSQRSRYEQEYLGVALTCSKVDDYDISVANCTCKEFLDGYNSTSGIAIAAEIKSIREYTIKRGEAKGQKMAFLTLSDSTCNLGDVVIFSEDYAKHKDKLQEKNVMLFRGIRQKGKEGLLIKNILPLRE